MLYRSYSKLRLDCAHFRCQQVGVFFRKKYFQYFQQFVHRFLERGTPQLNKQEKNSHEDAGFCKVDILNSNFPPLRMKLTIFHHKFCKILVGLEVVCLAGKLKVPGSSTSHFFIFPLNVAGNLNCACRLYRYQHLHGNFFLFFFNYRVPLSN